MIFFNSAKLRSRVLLVVVFLCTILSLNAQDRNPFADASLREHALNLSKEDPYVLYVYDFCSRYFSELKKKSPQEQKECMTRDDVKILKGDLEKLDLIDAETNMRFRSEDNFYRVSFFKEKTVFLDFEIPASCQLLLGKNLIQLENEFIKDLLSYQTKITELKVDKKKIEPLADHFYIQKGKTYYIEQINNYTYYQQDLLPVFSTEHPGESVNNLFLLKTPQFDKQLELTIRKYGLAKEKLTTSIANFVDYTKNKGCEVYIGIEHIDSKAVHAILFAVNEPLRYNHVMNLVVPYSLLQGEDAQIEGDINLFIPMNNISSLFYEDSLVNKHFKN